MSFPRTYLFTVSRLMAEYQAFKEEQVDCIDHNGKLITFSDDGNHMVSQSFNNGQCRILSLSPVGNWVKKATVNSLSMLEFSGVGKHLLISNSYVEHIIYALKPDGNWILESNLPQGTYNKFTVFSPDGFHAAIIDFMNTLKIFGRGTDGA